MKKLDRERTALGKTFSSIFYRRVFLGAVCLISFVFFAMLTILVINPIREVYQATFEYDFPGIETKKYPDESDFDYRTLICGKNLEIIKNSNDDYRFIDIYKMYRNNDISIKEVTKKEVTDV